jgi:cytochrome P450
MRLTLGVVGKTLFSTDISGEASELGRAMTEALEYVTFRTRRPFALPPRVPTPRSRRFHAAMRTFDQIVYGLIADRRRAAAPREDLLSVLLAARDGETGEALSDREIRDEVVTFLTAGHETTAVALSWTWYLLSRHPEAARRVRAELADVLRGQTPTVEHLPRLEYTKRVIEEVMRLYPPAWAVERSAVGDDELGGYPIPAGSAVDLSPYVTHRHPAFWENPEGFDPDRFTPERAAGRPRFAYFPFGGGPRHCIGSEFAMLEAQLVVAMVAQRYRLELVPGYRAEPDSTIVLRPRPGVVMTLRKA